MGENLRTIPIPDSSVLNCGVQRDIVSSVGTTVNSQPGSPLSEGERAMTQGNSCLGSSISVYMISMRMPCVSGSSRPTIMLSMRPMPGIRFLRRVVNKLTDLRQDEFAAFYTEFKPVSRWSGLPRLSAHEYNRVPLVSSVEWMTQGVVTPVKNQGQCSSWWSCLRCTRKPYGR